VNRFKLADFKARYAVADKRFDAVSSLLALSSSGPWLVGGSVRRLLAEHKQDSDFDVAFASAAQLAELQSKLAAAGFTKARETAFHVEMTGKIDGEATKVQLLRHAHAATPEALIDTFDFTICMFAFDGTDVVCGPLSLWDLARKRLVLHRLTFAASTVRRLTKYARQGYTFCQGSIVSILEEVAKNPDSIKGEVAYVD
jgi:hypothetical protein